jgi:SAM-dependent methyltransferase
MLDRLRYKSYKGDIKRFRDYLESNSNARLLDTGCGDGLNTIVFAKKIQTSNIVGIDVKNFGPPFPLLRADLDRGLPVVDSSFDIVTSYHVIEHLSNTDLYVKELFRILKPGGYLLIATPNLASGRIILELLLNKQPNMAHVSDFFILRGDPGGCWKASVGYLHRRLFTLEGLTRLLTYYGFKIEITKRSGYGFLPIDWLLRGLYASNLIVKARK